MKIKLCPPTRDRDPGAGEVERRERATQVAAEISLNLEFASFKPVTGDSVSGEMRRPTSIGCFKFAALFLRG